MVWTIELTSAGSVEWYRYQHEVWEWHELVPTYVETRPGYVKGLRHSFIDRYEHKVMVF